MSATTVLSLRRAVAALLVAAGVCLGGSVAPALAAGIDELSLTFHEPSTAFRPDTPVVPVTQAGAHADVSTEFRLPRHLEGSDPAPDEMPRDMTFDLPPGLYGNPQAAAFCSPATFVNGDGYFPPCPVDSQVGVFWLGPDHQPDLAFPYPVYNIEPLEGETAAFAFKLAEPGSKVRISVRTDGDHGLRATIKNITETVNVHSGRLTLWGVPADPAHDVHRFDPATFSFDAAATQERKPFMTLPARCDAPLVTTMHVRDWTDRDGRRIATRTATTPALTGCDKLKFDAGIKVAPEDPRPDVPSAFDVDLSVPQDDDPDGLGTPTVGKAVVTLPEGVAIAPPSAAGLGTCDDGDAKLGSTADVTCPETSKIGSVSIRTPVLETPLTGDVHMRPPKPGELFRLLIVARGSGMVIKLPGVARPDARTGQITTTFENTPQLPFDLLQLRFRGGARAPLATPQTCGTKTATASITPHSGAAATPSSSFEIGRCGVGFGLAPTLEAGSLSPLAGAYSPFSMTIRRPDGQQDIQSIALDMPAGLLGMVARVPQCPEVAAAAGSCGAESQIGTTTVGAGAGPNPFHLPGRVFLAGPYKGAPFSLSIVVRAIAGPFDLGTVVVRAPINVDAATAKLGVPSDPLPTILEGVPLRLRTINITIDRPDFMFNPTSCDPMQIGATVTGTSGAVAKTSVPFQARGCANLPLRPQLALRLTGKNETTDGKHPGVRALLTQQPGEAGLKEVKVKLPLSVALDPDNAQTLCKPAQAAARTCPAGSIVGRATAVTPALSQPLTGPVYFVEATRTTASGQTRRTLPRLWLALAGEVPLDLWASSSVEDEHLVTTFAMIPDAPISRFDLTIDGGKNGILAANTNICAARQMSDATFTGQNGRRVPSRLELPTDCGFKVASASGNRSGVRVVTSGVGAGTVKVSGRGLRTTKRKLRGRVTVARITTALTMHGRDTLSRRRSMKTKVTVAYTPPRGKTRRTSRVITLKHGGS